MQPIATIIAALIAAFLGSWFGAHTALSRFKKERAFDRRLAWYEKMIDALLDAAKSLGIARTFERGVEAKTDSVDDALEAWQQVQFKHLAVNQITEEGVLYAKRESYIYLWNATERLQDLANATDAFHGLAGSALKDVRPVMNELRRAAGVLAEDIRTQLGLEPLGQHPRDIDSTNNKLLKGGDA